MKTKIRILTIALTLIALQATCQIKVGFYLGTTFNNVSATGIPDVVSNITNTQTGVTFGISAERPLVNDFAISAEMNYVEKGFSIAQGTSFSILGIDVPLGAKVKTKLNYIQVPILGKYYIKREGLLLYVEAGPSIGYAMNGTIRPQASFLLDFNLPQVDINFGSDNYKRIELAGNLGAGVALPIRNTNGSLTGNIRYTSAFTNVLSDRLIDIDIKNKGWSMGIGYAMQF